MSPEPNIFSDAKWLLLVAQLTAIITALCKLILALTKFFNSARHLFHSTTSLLTTTIASVNKARQLVFITTHRVSWEILRPTGLCQIMAEICIQDGRLHSARNWAQLWVLISPVTAPRPLAMLGAIELLLGHPALAVGTLLKVETLIKRTDPSGWARAVQTLAAAMLEDAYLRLMEKQKSNPATKLVAPKALVGSIKGILATAFDQAVVRGTEHVVLMALGSSLYVMAVLDKDLRRAQQVLTRYGTDPEFRNRVAGQLRGFSAEDKKKFFNAAHLPPKVLVTQHVGTSTVRSRTHNLKWILPSIVLIGVLGSALPVLAQDSPGIMNPPSIQVVDDREWFHLIQACYKNQGFAQLRSCDPSGNQLVPFLPGQEKNRVSLTSPENGGLLVFAVRSLKLQESQLLVPFLPGRDEMRGILSGELAVDNPPWGSMLGEERHYNVVSAVSIAHLQ